MLRKDIIKVHPDYSRSVEKVLKAFDKPLIIVYFAPKAVGYEVEATISEAWQMGFQLAIEIQTKEFKSWNYE